MAATSFKASSQKPAPAKPQAKPATTAQKPAPAVHAKPPAVQQQAKLPAGLASRMKKAAETASGFETMAAKNYAIPFFKIVDKSSKICMEGHSDYIEGCRPGMIFNTVTKKLYPANVGIYAVPCGFKDVVLEWESTEPGSGFVAEHPATTELKQEAHLEELPGGRKVLMLPNDHVLQDSSNYYVLVVDPETKEVEQGMISMTGSNLKISRQWNSSMNALRVDDGAGGRFRPPTYGVIWHLTTKQEQKDDYVYGVWVPSDPTPIEDEGLFTQAEDFFDTFTKGLAKGNYESAAKTGGLEDGMSTEHNRDDDTPM